LLNVLGMSRHAASVAKVICFTCRESTCACVSSLNHSTAEHGVYDLRPQRSQMARAVAWLGGACVAGTALGAAVALLLGG
jgi:hypothetical protein